MAWLRCSANNGSRQRLSSAIRTRAILTAALCGLCVILTGCGGEPLLVPPQDTSSSPPAATKLPPSPTAPAAIPSTPSTPATAAPTVDAIVWAEAVDPATNAPTAPVETFSPETDRIIAAVLVHALPAGATLEATWEYNNTSLDAFTRRVAIAETAAERWVTFYIARGPDTPWPVGTYAVTIALNGEVVQHAAIDVAEGG